MFVVPKLFLPITDHFSLVALQITTHTPSVKHTASEQALVQVQRAATAARGRLTPQDAAAATGLAVDEARDALGRMIELYVSRVTADENGNLLFVFEMPFRQRGTLTAAERLAALRDKAWRTFKRIYRMLIGVTLVVYFAVMLLAVLALMLALRSTSDNDRDRDDGDGLAGGLMHMLGEGLRAAFWYNVYVGDLEPAVTRGRRKVKEKKKSFFVAVYDFALGPERPMPDAFADEREVAAFLSRREGVLVPAEIVALSGVPFDGAEERMAEYLVRFDGEPSISEEEGAVVGEFESYTSGRVESAGDASVLYWWQEIEKPFEHSGNSSGQNAGAIGIMAFTGLASIAMMAGGLKALALYGHFFTTGAATVLLGWLPLLLAVSYFLLAIVRLPGVARQEAARRRRDREKRVARLVFERHMTRASLDEFAQALSTDGGEPIDRSELESILNGLMPKFQGEVQLAENGTPLYAFERVERELGASRRVRDSKSLPGGSLPNML